MKYVAITFGLVFILIGFAIGAMVTKQILIVEETAKAEFYKLQYAKCKEGK